MYAREEPEEEAKVQEPAKPEPPKEELRVEPAKEAHEEEDEGWETTGASKKQPREPKPIVRKPVNTATIPQQARPQQPAQQKLTVPPAHMQARVGQGPVPMRPPAPGTYMQMRGMPPPMPLPGQSIFSGGGFSLPGLPQNVGMPVFHPAQRAFTPGQSGPVREATPQSYEDAMNMFSQKSAAQDVANEKRRRKIHGHLDKIREAEAAGQEEYYDEEDDYGPELGQMNMMMQDPAAVQQLLTAMSGNTVLQSQLNPNQLGFLMNQQNMGALSHLISSLPQQAFGAH